MKTSTLHLADEILPARGWQTRDHKHTPKIALTEEKQARDVIRAHRSIIPVREAPVGKGTALRAVIHQPFLLASQKPGNYPWNDKTHVHPKKEDAISR